MENVISKLLEDFERGKMNPASTRTELGNRRRGRRGSTGLSAIQGI